MKTLYTKIIKWTVFIVFISLVLLYTIPFPINKELDAVEIKLDDPSYLETRTIYISGTYRLNLFIDNTFKGQIFIPEYEITSERMSNIQFMRGKDNVCPLIYRYEVGTDVDGRPLKEYYSFGWIVSKLFLYRPVIMVSGQSKGEKIGWRSDRGYCIVASAGDREEALEILAKYDIFPPEYYE